MLAVMRMGAMGRKGITKNVSEGKERKETQNRGDDDEKEKEGRDRNVDGKQQ